MTAQDARVDRMQRLFAGETDGEHAEVTLETRIDGETSRRRIHTSDVLHVVYLLQRQLLTVVPVPIVQVLTNERVRRHGTVVVDSRHVHIVDEVDQLLRARRTVVSSGLLLERLFHDVLKHRRRRVVVERNCRDEKVVAETVQLVADHHRLAAARAANQHDGTTICHEEVHEVAKANRFCRVHENGLKRRLKTNIIGTLILYLQGHVWIKFEFSNFFCPQGEFLCFVVDEVVENGSLRWKFDRFEFGHPPLAKLDPVIDQLQIEENF